MKPAAFVSDGHSLGETLDELRALNCKVFATPKAMPLMEECGIRAQSLADPIGVARIFAFGHKEIHLFGFDLCNDGTEGSRVCFENEVFYTTADLAVHAQMLLRACAELTARGAAIAVHGRGMFESMARSLVRGANERVLNAVYDLTVCPPTYEVFSFLSQAEKYRSERGYTHIDLFILPGPMHGFRDDGLPPSPAHRAGMLHRICVAGARLLPTVRNVHVMKDRVQMQGDIFPTDWTNEQPRFLYGPRFQVNAHRCLQATQGASAEIARRFTKPYSTITLRESNYWPQRNSNLAVWTSAARELMLAGIPAVIVPDTYGHALPGFDNLDAAAWDIDLRLALYEGAALNMGVMNGPMVLPMFARAECPYIIFQKPDESSPGTQAEFMAAQGIKHGDQYGKNGLTVWENDTPDAVSAALHEWSKRKVMAA